jgi:hypothetical protein
MTDQNQELEKDRLEGRQNEPSATADRPDRMIPVSGDASQLQNTSEDVDERDDPRRRPATNPHRESFRPSRHRAAPDVGDQTRATVIPIS